MNIQFKGGVLYSLAGLLITIVIVQVFTGWVIPIIVAGVAGYLSLSKINWLEGLFALCVIMIGNTIALTIKYVLADKTLTKQAFHQDIWPEACNVATAVTIVYMVAAAIAYARKQKAANAPQGTTAPTT